MPIATPSAFVPAYSQSTGMGQIGVVKRVTRGQAGRIRNNLARTYGRRTARRFFRLFRQVARQGRVNRLHANIVNTLLQRVGVNAKHASMLIASAQGRRVPFLWQRIRSDIVAAGQGTAAQPRILYPEIPMTPFGAGTWVRPF